MARMKLRALAAAGLIACCIVPATTAADAERDLVETMHIGGRERTYRLHLPPPGQSNAPRPLVLVFHGGGGTAAGAARVYGFDQAGDARGFLVAYPDGVSHRWNDGRDLANARGTTEPVDDVGFVSALIDRLIATYRVDPSRVYAAGHSNGGIFAHRLACELAGKIAAIAPVAGTIAEPEVQRCAPGVPVSVISWHGTADRFVPYGGGGIRGSGARGRVMSADETAALWVRVDGCPAAVQQSSLAPVEPKDPTRVRRSAWGPCRRGSEVILYTIDGGGHGWPGTTPRLGVILGPVSHQINATQTIMEFFEGHPRK